MGIWKNLWQPPVPTCMPGFATTVQQKKMMLNAANETERVALLQWVQLNLFVFWIRGRVTSCGTAGPRCKLGSLRARPRALVFDPH